MYSCCLCSDFSFSQSSDESMRGVHGTYCMSLGSILHPSGTHYSPFVRGQHIISFGACVYNILRHGTLEILQLCHLGICMYTMETRKGLTEYPYTLHIEEVRKLIIHVPGPYVKSLPFIGLGRGYWYIQWI